MRLFVAAVLITLLVPVVAQAEVTLTYTGETPEDGYGSNDLWDYSYSIEGASASNFMAFAIVCPVAPYPGSVVSPDNWDGVWSDSINTAGIGSISEVATMPGIVWTYHGTFPWDYPSSPLVFSFQTDIPYSPVMQAYDGDSWTGKSDYSAGSGTPEPCSVVLLSMVMAGGTFWRRRRLPRK